MGGWVECGEASPLVSSLDSTSLRLKFMHSDIIEHRTSNIEHRAPSTMGVGAGGRTVISPFFSASQENINMNHDWVIVLYPPVYVSERMESNHLAKGTGLAAGYIAARLHVRLMTSLPAQSQHSRLFAEK